MSKPNSFVPDEVYRLNTVVRFGKHKDSTIQQIIDSDPKWLQWAVDEEIISLTVKANEELERALEKVPNDFEEGLGSYFEDIY